MYDFPTLVAACPELKPYLLQTKANTISIDFSNPVAVKLLNTAILKSAYQLDYWDFPEGYLCPGVPGRTTYVDQIAKFLAKDNQGKIPRGKNIAGLDIGTGASLIYPIIGNQKYRWSFVGVDIDKKSIASSSTIIEKNKNKLSNIELRLQENPRLIFDGIMKRSDYFDVTLCNPPFHDSAKSAQSANQRKNTNLHSDKKSPNSLNFGGTANELWTAGGEIGFITKMINESTTYSKNILWFSTLISRQASIQPILKTLEKQKIAAHHLLDISHGNKQMRILVWTFLEGKQREAWRKWRW